MTIWQVNNYKNGYENIDFELKFFCKEKESLARNEKQAKLSVQKMENAFLESKFKHKCSWSKVLYNEKTNQLE